MTYIDYLNDFNQWLESNPLPGNAQLLYFRLLNVFNRAGWPEQVQVDTLRLMLMMDCRKDAAYRARDRLRDAGFIQYRKGKKGSPTAYFLSDKTTVSATENATVSATENATENATHIKTKTKTKTKRVSPPVSPSPGEVFGGALLEAVEEWLAYKREKRQGYKPTGLRSLLSQIRKKADTHGEEAVCALIRECMASNWQGIIWERLEKGAKREKEAGFVYDPGDLEGSL